MPKLNEQISSLETKFKQLKVRKLRIDARARALASRRARKDDTRRKILIGAIVLARVEHGTLPGRGAAHLARRRAHPRR
jgi:hypothetical protein